MQVFSLTLNAKLSVPVVVLQVVHLVLGGVTHILLGQGHPGAMDGQLTQLGQ